MTKKDFEQLIKEQVLFLDGATGSNLINAGMPAGISTEKWILEHPEVFVQMQREYVEAGSHIILAPTFAANRIKFKKYGKIEELEDTIHNLVLLSKEAAMGKAYVAADISMTGEQLEPMGDLSFEELVEVYKEQVRFCEKAGVDLFLIETIMSLQEMRAAIIAAKEVSELPILASLTFESNGLTLYGTDPSTAVIALQQLGVSAVGVNCGNGPEKIVEIIETMSMVAQIPLLAKPNAGLPYLDPQGITRYSMGAEEFSTWAPRLVEAGASIIGGCCGSTPEHMRQFIAKAKGLKPPKNKSELPYLLCSERKTFSFHLEDPFFLIGERINPTGKKAFQESLKQGDTSMAEDFAVAQTQAGVALLDINVGMAGIEEEETMLETMAAVATVCSTPLVIDTSHPKVMEAALRQYPGRALINSISLEETKIKEILPLAKKYGAMFILLPLSDAGLPKSLEEKIQIIETIRSKAHAMGFTDRDIVVDGLVTTVGANPNAALETLETIRYCKEQGLATVCGLSNVSFGLPGRSYVNSCFLAMAIQTGLSMAIANPNQELLMATALSSNLLRNKKEAALPYINYAKSIEPAKATVKATETKKTEVPKQTIDFEPLQDAVIKGKRDEASQLTKDYLEHSSAEEILSNHLMPAMDQVGNFFETGRYFLPQLIASAEAMSKCVSILEPLLTVEGGMQDLPVVVIASVKGDVHDIGKNLVALMLKNHGFSVIDLGKDVPTEDILVAAKNHKASIIALSALMTTTMVEMKEVVQRVKKEKLSCKVMIGGAVITADYAKEIGADGYSKDAAEAVKLAKSLLE